DSPGTAILFRYIMRSMWILAGIVEDLDKLSEKHRTGTSIPQKSLLVRCWVSIGASDSKAREPPLCAISPYYKQRRSSNCLLHFSIRSRLVPFARKRRPVSGRYEKGRPPLQSAQPEEPAKPVCHAAQKAGP